MTRKFWWGDFKAADFADIDPQETIAVLPLAAIEQHGPHLPLSTDLVIMQGMLDAVRAQLRADHDVRVLPIQSVCKSDEHMSFPGTLTISGETMIAAVTDMALSVARTGIRKLVLVTSHGGNEEVMGIVSRTMRLEASMLAVRTSWGRFGTPEGLFTDDELRIGVHGGDYETSLMLRLAPSLVDMDAAEDFQSSVTDARKQFKHLAAQSPHGFGWLAEDLNPAGVVGNAKAATAEKGAAALAHQARGFTELLEDIRRADLDEILA